MLRMSLPWMLQVVEAIDELSRVQAKISVSDNWMQLFSAQQQLNVMFGQSIYSPYLRTSRDKANELHAQIDSILNNGSDLEREVTDFEVWSLNQKREQFRLVFLSELSIIPSFLVAPKESYDISLLIDNGVALFPPSMSSKAPETRGDAMEAGKALAFELATACGFHVFRVTESVLKRYWDEISSGKKRPNLETIGNYASELEKGSFGERKVWESLKQLAKLHRNPLIHPEVILTVEEAIGIIGIARSVVGAMLTDLPDVPPTTGAPSS